MNKTIAITSDHGGYTYKQAIQEKFDSYEWLDLGPHDSSSVDYPDYAKILAEKMGAENINAGILICGTGIGISMAANRYSHIRAALCTDTTMARLTRAHNNANVLALGERIIGLELAFDIVDTFLNTEFEGGRHERRVNKINI